MGNPDSALQQTAKVMKQAEKVGNGIHELTGVAGFFHPVGSIAHGSISLGLALGNYMNAGIHGYMGLYYMVTGNEEEERRQRKIVNKSIHNMGENLKDVAWDAVFLVPFTKILAKLGKVLKIANKLLSLLKKLEKFTTKMAKITKLSKKAAKLQEKATVLEKKLVVLIEKEYGPIASECLQNFKKWTFPSYKETIKGWKEKGANVHEVFEFIQSVVGQIKFICDSVGKYYEEFEKMLPDWLRKDADKQMEQLFAEADNLEKEVDSVSVDELGEVEEKEEEEEYEEVYIKGPQEKYYDMDEKELDDSIRQSRKDKKEAEARAEEAEEQKKRLDKQSKKYATKEEEAKSRMDEAEKRKKAAQLEISNADLEEEYYQSKADITDDKKKKDEYQKKADDAAEKRKKAEKKVEQAESDRAKASDDMQNAALSRSLAEAGADAAEAKRQKAEDDAWMANYEKELAKKEKKEREGIDERIAANENIAILEGQLDIYKRKYDQAKADEFAAVVNGWGKDEVQKAKKEAEKWKGKMNEIQGKINELNRKAKK